MPLNLFKKHKTEENPAENSLKIDVPQATSAQEKTQSENKIQRPGYMLFDYYGPKNPHFHRTRAQHSEADGPTVFTTGPSAGKEDFSCFASVHSFYALNRR